MKNGFTFRDRSGDIKTAQPPDDLTPIAAVSYVAYQLHEAGYSPRKWWQFWRSDETYPCEELRTELRELEG